MANKSKPVNHGQSVWNAHGNFKKTGNILYAVIAIGEKTPPPEWAVNACRDYFMKASISHTDIAVLRITDLNDARYDVGELLERVAKLMLDPRVSELAAIKQVLGKDAGDAAIRALQRKRAKEIVRVEGEDGEIVDDDHRANRLIVEQASPKPLIFKKRIKS